MWNLPTPKYVKEFEPQLNTVSKNKARSCSFDTQLSTCSEDEDMNATMMTSMPKIVPISSHGSFSDSTISSSATSSRCASPATASTLSSSPASPRSIFPKYWSTQNNNSGDSSKDFPAPMVQNSRGGVKEVLLKDLESLHLNDDINSSKRAPPALSVRSSSIKTKGSAVTQMTTTQQDASKPKQRPSIDDSTIDYNPQNKNRPNSSRRQILPQYEVPSKPTPPPSSYSTRHYGYPRRKWSSTTALLKRPTHSCLRPSRYSCSMIDERKLSRPSKEDVHHQGNSDEDGTDTARIATTRASLPRSKSVSFYSQVSVFEFVNYTKGLEDVGPSQDWSKYFA